jgi:hypothetical protein
MIINQVVETPEGEVEVHANLSNEQVKFLIEVGLNVVLAKGAKPFIQTHDYTADQILTGNGTVQ